MDPTIDPGYGESMLQMRPGETREEGVARYNTWGRETRAEALRKARAILAAEPRESVPVRWPSWLLFAILLVLIAAAALVLGVLLMLASIVSLVVGPVVALAISCAVPLITAIHVWIRRRIRRKPLAELVNHESSREEAHA